LLPSKGSKRLSYAPRWGSLPTDSPSEIHNVGNVPGFIFFPAESMEFDLDYDESVSTDVNLSQFTFHCCNKYK
jgi:hypothetical protein